MSILRRILFLEAIMNQLQKPTVTIINNQPKTTSLDLARNFEKQHKNILRDVQTLECSEKFTKLNFELSEYKDKTGRKLPYYQITRDGFTFLVMGFTGKKAARWKERYIEAFNAMEQKLIQQKINVKTCSKCGLVKSLSDFNRNSKVKDGRRADCKTCSRKWARKQRQIKKVPTKQLALPEFNAELEKKAKRFSGGHWDLHTNIAPNLYKDEYNKMTEVHKKCKKIGAIDPDTTSSEDERIFQNIGHMLEFINLYAPKIIPIYLKMKTEAYEGRYVKKMFEKMAAETKKRLT